MQAKYINIPFVAVFSFILIGLFAFPAVAAETYKLDPDHTSIIFRVKHLSVANVYGRFSGATGSFVFDEKSPANNSIEIQVGAETVNTAVDQRDKHLRSPDFFDVTEYPLILFKSKSVRKLDNNNFEVSGDLMLLGQTRPLSVVVVQTGQGKDPWGNFRRGFETTFTIKRSDFGMNFMPSVASDEVNLSVSLEGIKQ